MLTFAVCLYGLHSKGSSDAMQLKLQKIYTYLLASVTRLLTYTLHLVRIVELPIIMGLIFTTALFWLNDRSSFHTTSKLRKACVDNSGLKLYKSQFIEQQFNSNKGWAACQISRLLCGYSTDNATFLLAVNRIAAFQPHSAIIHI